jgi:hypothetical protein
MDLKTILAKMEQLGADFIRQHTTIEQKAMVAKALGFRFETPGTEPLQKVINLQQQMVDLLEKTNKQLDDAKDLVLWAGKRRGELEARIGGLELELATARKDEHTLRRSITIEGAMTAGRIFPVNRAFWEQQYDKDPEGTMQTLASLPRSPYFEEIGVGTGGEESDFGPADAKVAEKLQLTPEDYRKFQSEKPKQG